MTLTKIENETRKTTVRFRFGFTQKTRGFGLKTDPPLSLTMCAILEHFCNDIH